MSACAVARGASQKRYPAGAMALPGGAIARTWPASPRPPRRVCPLPNTPNSSYGFERPAVFRHDRPDRPGTTSTRNGVKGAVEVPSVNEKQDRLEWKKWLQRNHNILIECGLPVEMFENRRLWFYFLEHAAYWIDGGE